MDPMDLIAPVDRQDEDEDNEEEDQTSTTDGIDGVTSTTDDANKGKKQKKPRGIDPSVYVTKALGLPLKTNKLKVDGRKYKEADWKACADELKEDFEWTQARIDEGTDIYQHYARTQHELDDCLSKKLQGRKGSSGGGGGASSADKSKSKGEGGWGQNIQRFVIEKKNRDYIFDTYAGLVMYFKSKEQPTEGLKERVGEAYMNNQGSFFFGGEDIKIIRRKKADPRSFVFKVWSDEEGGKLLFQHVIHLKKTPQSPKIILDDEDEDDEDPLSFQTPESWREFLDKAKEAPTSRHGISLKYSTGTLYGGSLFASIEPAMDSEGASGSDAQEVAGGGGGEKRTTCRTCTFVVMRSVEGESEVEFLTKNEIQSKNREILLITTKWSSVEEFFHPDPKKADKKSQKKQDLLIILEGESTETPKQKRQHIKKETLGDLWGEFTAHIEGKYHSHLDQLGDESSVGARAILSISNVKDTDKTLLIIPWKPSHVSLVAPQTKTYKAVNRSLSTLEIEPHQREIDIRGIDASEFQQEMLTVLLEKRAGFSRTSRILDQDLPPLSVKFTWGEKFPCSDHKGSWGEGRKTNELQRAVLSAKKEMLAYEDKKLETAILVATNARMKAVRVQVKNAVRESLEPRSEENKKTIEEFYKSIEQDLSKYCQGPTGWKFGDLSTLDALGLSEAQLAAVKNPPKSRGKNTESVDDTSGQKGSSVAEEDDDDDRIEDDDEDPSGLGEVSVEGSYTSHGSRGRPRPGTGSPRHRRLLPHMERRSSSSFSEDGSYDGSIRHRLSRNGYLFRPIG